MTSPRDRSTVSRVPMSPVGSRSSRCASGSSRSSPTCSTNDSDHGGAVMAETMQGPTTKAGRSTFARMDESTKDHWNHIAEESIADWPNVADRFLAMLRELEPVTNGFAVNQLVHACQTAARAERAGADDEVVFAALCHDIAKAVSEPNHPATAAALLKPYVRPEVEW